MTGADTLFDCMSSVTGVRCVREDGNVYTESVTPCDMK